MVTVTPWGGVGTIGGNKILLQADGTNVLLDFGTCFATRGRYYEEFLSPRSTRGLLDFLQMGLLPPIRGIYREDLVPRRFDVWQRVPPRLDLDLHGVLLSHAHLDHSSYISFLRPDVPVYCGRLTAVLCKAIQDCGRSDTEREISALVPRTEEDGLLRSSDYGRCPAVQRPFRLVADGDGPVPEGLTGFWGQSYTSRRLTSAPLCRAESVGGLPVRRFDVDHSIPGASAFAVETQAGWIVYTGDLRAHGANAQATARFAEAARELRPALLICEGTRVDEAPGANEQAVFEHALQHVSHAAGRLVIADFGARNIERLLTFLDIARESGRLLVLSAADAFLLRQLHAAGAAVPEPTADPHLMVLSEPKASLERWEKEYVRPWCEGARKLYGAEQLRQFQGDCILCWSFFDLNDLVDFAPCQGGAYIYSNTQAYTEQMQLDLGRLRNWLRHFGLALHGDPEAAAPAEPLHASGHISGPELLALIRQIAPRAVMPIHTERPEFFAEHLRSEMQVIMPEQGVPVVVD